MVGRQNVGGDRWHRGRHRWSKEGQALGHAKGVRFGKGEAGGQAQAWRTAGGASRSKLERQGSGIPPLPPITAFLVTAVGGPN